MKISELVADLLNVKNEYGDLECLNQNMKVMYLKPTVYVKDLTTGQLYDLNTGDGIVYSIAISKGDPNFSFSVVVG